MEYAILIIIIIAVLLSIQTYIKRGYQGRLRSAADDIGEQFSPGNTNASVVVSSSSNTHEGFLAGVTNSYLLQPEITNITSSTNIIDVNQEYWGN